MRTLALLALLLLPVACRSRIAPERPREIYGGVGAAGLPDVGVSVTGGQIFDDTKERFDFAFEVSAVYQGGEDSASQDGEFFQVLAGVKQIGSPGHRRHVVFRYGITWFRANGDPEIIDRPGDYLGGYAGVGYEWELTPRITFGPEARVIVADGEGSLGTEVLPQVVLHWILDF